MTGVCYNGRIAVVPYLIHTHTGSAQGSATDANVYVNLIGELGDMGNRHMMRSNNRIKFQEGQVLLALFYCRTSRVSQKSVLHR